MPSITRLAGLFVVALLAGCTLFQPSDEHRPPDGIVTTDRTAYRAIRRADENIVEMRVRYVNRTESPGFLEICGTVLQRLESGHWRDVWERPCVYGGEPFREVAAGATHQFLYRVSGSQSGGYDPTLDLTAETQLYRLVFRLHGSRRPGEPTALLPFEDRLTNEFTIRPPRLRSP